MDVKGNFSVAEGHLERFSSYLFRRKLGRKHNQNIVQNQNRLQKKINLSSVQDSNVAKVAAFSWTRRSFDDFVNNKCTLRIFTMALLDSDLCKVKNYISKKKRCKNRWWQLRIPYNQKGYQSQQAYDDDVSCCCELKRLLLQQLPVWSGSSCSIWSAVNGISSYLTDQNKTNTTWKFPCRQQHCYLFVIWEISAKWIEARYISTIETEDGLT